MIDALPTMLTSGEPGEAWFVQPGREPGPSRFRGVPGPAGAGAPPELTWDS